MPQLSAPLKSIAREQARGARRATICAQPASVVTPERADDGEREEGAHHEDFAVGEVDQLDDAVDQGVAERDQRDQRAVRDPDNQVLGEEGRS